MDDDRSRGGAKFGEIEIGGERWRWATIGHTEDGGGRTLREVRWSVSFRHPERVERRFWCDLPERYAAGLTERRLRRLFEEACAAAPPSREGGEVRGLEPS